MHCLSKSFREIARRDILDMIVIILVCSYDDFDLTPTVGERDKATVSISSLNFLRSFN